MEYESSILINKENTPITIVINDIPSVVICGNSVEIRNLDKYERDEHSKHGSIVYIQRWLDE